MEQEETSSFWAEIKKYEDILARDPASYSFSHLADLYRKIGLLDDAIALSEKGIELHPDYVGGYMALGRASYEKGLMEQSREALERVIRVTPENISAQKILSHIYVAMDEPKLAEAALKTVLAMNPSDEESRLSLDAITRTSSTRAEAEDSLLESGPPPDEEPLDDAELLLDAELVEEFDESEEESASEFPAQEEVIPEPADVGPADVAVPQTFATDSIDIISGRDPLTTATLAEIYISQGFLKRALTIYRDLLHADPENEELRKRLFDLKQMIDEDNAKARNDVVEEEPADEIAEDDFPEEEADIPGEVGEAGYSLEPEEVSPSPVPEPLESVLAEAPVAVAAPAEPISFPSDPVAILEGWLENIQRRRSCR